MKYKDIDLEELSKQELCAFDRENINRLLAREANIKMLYSQGNSYKLPLFHEDLDKHINDTLYETNPYKALRKAINKVYKLENNLYFRDITSSILYGNYDLVFPKTDWPIPTSPYIIQPDKRFDVLVNDYLVRAIKSEHHIALKYQFTKMALGVINLRYVDKIDNATGRPLTEVSRLYKYDLFTAVEQFWLQGLQILDRHMNLVEFKLNQIYRTFPTAQEMQTHINLVKKNLATATEAMNLATVHMLNVKLCLPESDGTYRYEPDIRDGPIYEHPDLLLNMYGYDDSISLTGATEEAADTI